MTADDLAAGSLYPRIRDLRAVTARVAEAVVREAREACVGLPYEDGAIPGAVSRFMWEPAYPELVPAPERAPRPPPRARARSLRMSALVLPRPAFAAARDEIVVLVGTANVGKSALFGALTGRYATVSNYPGTTVDVSSARAIVDGASVRRARHPGHVVAHPALRGGARHPRRAARPARARGGRWWPTPRTSRRGIALALQLAEMGVPFVVCANMMDEAEAGGLVAGPRAAGVPPGGGRGADGGHARRRAARPSARRWPAPAPSAARVAYPPAVERGGRGAPSLHADRAAWPPAAWR